MANLYTSGRFQGLDSAGIPLSGGKLCTYAAGTLTPLATYTTQAGDIANAVEVTLDSAGRASVWLSAASYRFILKTAAGVTVTDDDNISGGGSSSIEYIAAGSGAVATTTQAKLRESVSVLDFGADPTGATDSTAAFVAAFAASNDVYIPEPSSYYKLTASVAVGFSQRITGANSRIVQTTSNTPIFTVSSSKWKIDGLRLEYLVQQGVADTSAMAVDFGAAFEGEFTNCTIMNAYHGFGVAAAGSWAYECTFRNIRVIDAYDYGVAFNVNGSVGLTTNTFDNVYVLQTSNSNSNTASKGFLIQYHTGGFVMRNCAADKLQGGVALFVKGCTGGVIDVFYAELCKLYTGRGLLTVDSCFGLSIDGYMPWFNIGVLSGGQTASFVRVVGSTTSVNLVGREVNTDTTGNAGTIYGIDSNGSSAAVRVEAKGFYTDSAFARLDALVTAAYYQIWGYDGQTLQEEILGRKTQYRSAAPTTGTWIQGDTIINSSISTSSPVDTWRCVIAGTPGTWRPVSWAVFKGTTAARPTMTAQDIGVGYMDTTIDADGKPIWWNGTAWVDGVGAPV